MPSITLECKHTAVSLTNHRRDIPDPALINVAGPVVSVPENERDTSETSHHKTLDLSVL